jgi:hypothetical protein
MEVKESKVKQSKRGGKASRLPHPKHSYVLIKT